MTGDIEAPAFWAGKIDSLEPWQLEMLSWSLQCVLDACRGEWGSYKILQSIANVPTEVSEALRTFIGLGVAMEVYAPRIDASEKVHRCMRLVRSLASGVGAYNSRIDAHLSANGGSSCGG